MLEPKRDLKMKPDVAMLAASVHEGGLQRLHPGDAENRLRRALRQHRTQYLVFMAENEPDDQALDFFLAYGYRSVAYDAGALTESLTRVFPTESHDIGLAHSELFASLVAGAERPDADGLLDLAAYLNPEQALKDGNLWHAQQTLKLDGVFAPHQGECKWQVCCPMCQNENVDRDGEGGDHTAVTTHEDNDEYGCPLGTRGGWTEVRYTCGNGHSFSLLVANHKGAEYIGLV
jgi:hypothetical protein